MESAYASAKGALSAETTERPSVVGAITSAERAHGFLCEAAEQAERLAGILGGTQPPDNAPAAGKAEHEPTSLADALNRRISRLSDPSYRIRAALERIERAIG